MTNAEINRKKSKWETIRSETEDHDTIREKDFEFLKICVDQNDNNINFYFRTKADKTREEFVSQIIFEDSSLGCIFKDSNKNIDNEGKQYLRFLVDWFLKRYDIPTSRILLKYQKKSEAESPPERVSNISTVFKTIFTTKFPYLAFFVLLVSFVLIPLCGWFQPTEDSQAIWNWNPCFLTNILSDKIPSYFLYSHIYIFSSLSILYFLWGFKHYGLLYYKLWLPRMFGGIILGYLPLLMTDEIWKWLLNFPLGLTLLIFVGTTVLCLIYLWIDVYNITNNIWLSMERSIRVLFWGLFQSLLIGIILSEIFANTIVYNLIQDANWLRETNYPVFGWLGIYFPKALLCYFPLALLIGIFLQIFWEEKPITHPI